MIVTLQTERIRTIEQVAAFVEANEPVEFQPVDRAGAYDVVSRTLARLGYRALDKPSKALVKRYLAKTTGYSRAQRTRLIRQCGGVGRKRLLLERPDCIRQGLDSSPAVAREP